MRRSWFILSILVLGLFTAVVIVVSSNGRENTTSGTLPQVASEAPGCAPAPSGEAMPVGDLPGWHQTFTDDFTTPVPLGNFPTDVSSTWAAYPSPWKDTSQYGIYSPLKDDSVSGGILNQFIHTEDGVPRVSALQPKLTSATSYGQTYGRYAIRFRADSLPGYKMAWMLWPDSENQPRDGEIDFPEMNLDSTTMWGYVHPTNSTGPTDQALFNPKTPLTGWHTAVIEWAPTSVVFILDGAEVGRTTDRVPSASMHWVLQTETALNTGGPPSPTVAGNVQIDWIAAWAYDGTTVDRQPPTTNVTAPTAGATVSGSAQTISATAADPGGVVGVQFQVDGANLGAEVTTAPYSTPWNTLVATNGAHVITAVGRDTNGNTGPSPGVTVTVANGTDTTPPTFKPSPCATGCTVFPQTGGSVLATFNEKVVGVSGTTFTLKNKVSGVPVAANVTYTSTATTSVATLMPTDTLLADQKYTATISTGITDVAGNPAAPFTWSFSVGPRPQVTTTPVAATTGVDTSSTVTATFTENVRFVDGTTFLLKAPDGSVVNANVTYDSASMTATLDPSGALAANTKYTASLSGLIRDAVDNAIIPKSWFFTTGT